MAITDEDLVLDRPHPNLDDGRQRIYDLGLRHGLSAVNCPALHAFPFAWEIAVLKDFRINDAGDYEYSLDYTTELTRDVVTFFTDEVANQFIERARALFRGPSWWS